MRTNFLVYGVRRAIASLRWWNVARILGLSLLCCGICTSAEISAATDSLIKANDPMIEKWRPYFGLMISIVISLSTIVVLLLVILHTKRRSELALQKSENNYRELFNFNSEAIMIHDIDTGAILEVNHRFSVLFGYSSEVARVMKLSDMSSGVAPYSEADGAEWFKKTREEGPQLFEWQARHANGQLFWVEILLHLEELDATKRIVASVRDITERKRAIAHAKAVEHQLTQTLQNLPIALFAVDTEHRVTQWNAVLEKITKLSAKQMLGKAEAWRGFYMHQQLTLADHILRGTSIAEMNAQYHGIISNSTLVDGAIEAERHMAHLGEHGLWLHFTAAPLLAEDGKLIGALETLIDITERKWAEIALRESEASYRTLIEYAPEAILVLSADDHSSFVECNRHAVELLGYQQAQLFHMNPLTVSYSIQADGRSPRQVIGDYIDQALSGVEVRFEWLCRHANGDPIPCEIHLIKLPGKQQTPLIRCSLTDITERKAAQAEILRERNFLETLLEAIPIPIFYKNNEGVYLGCNSAFLNMTHVERSRFIGKKAHDWLPKEVADLYVEKDAELFDDQQKQVFQRMISFDGDMPRHAIFHRAIYRDQDGNIDGVIGAILDVTELEKTKIALEHLNLALESRVLERTSELQKAMEQLIQSEKLAALGNLVAGIAHELNTPIGNIVTIASTLKDESTILNQKLNDGTIKRSEALQSTNMLLQASQMIEKNAVRSAKLISDFKQVAVDQSSSRRREFDLRNTVEEVMSTLLPMLKRTAHEVQIQVPEKLLLDSFPGAIEQIITNLITNSLTHGLEHKEQGHISISAKLENESVVIDYADDGKGMDAETLAHLFDPFYTTKLGQGGSGLGLYIVYNLVTGVLGGKIQVNSSINGGARFVLSLPLSAP